VFRFSDHRTAGELLATVLEDFAERTDVVIFALREHAADVAVAVADVLRLSFAHELPPVTPIASFQNRTIILVDDGFETASELVRLVAEVRVHNPARVIVAAPVASVDAVAGARRAADGWAFLATPTPFHSVGFWYEDSMRRVSTTLFAGRSRLPQRIAALAS
jgi:predicted phosphoribosyltransferase